MMIKEDQKKEDIKLKQRADLARREQQERQYKKYIENQNKQFA